MADNCDPRELQLYLHKLAQALTEAQGHLYTWQVQEPDEGADWHGRLFTAETLTLIQPGSRHVPYGLYVRKDRMFAPLARTRLEISGIYPRANDGDDCRSERDTWPQITCAGTRSPKSVAGDIVRRFLPEYVEQVYTSVEAIEKHEAYVAGKDSIAEALLAADPKAERYNDSDRVGTRYGAGDPSWTAQVGTDHVIWLKIDRLAPGQAAAIVSHLAQLREEGKEVT